MEHDSIRDTRGGDFAWFHRAFLDLNLGWKANIVYMGLVTFANGKTQECFPSKGTLAKLLGVSKPTIFRGLKTLEGAGVIRIDSRSTGRGQISNEYILLPTPVSIGYGVPCVLDTPPVSVGHPNKKKINKKNLNEKKNPWGDSVLGVKFSNTYPKRVDDENESARVRWFRREAEKVAKKRFSGDMQAAENWLLGRATSYVNSVKFVTTQIRFIPFARNWLLHKVYDQSDESWTQSAKQAGYMAERAQLARIM